MLKNKKFTKKLAIGAASLLLIAPLALSNAKASQNVPSQNLVSNYVTMNMTPSQQKSHHLTKTVNNGNKFTRPQLKYVYSATYNNNHQQSLPQNQIQKKANHLTNAEIVYTIDSLFNQQTNSQPAKSSFNIPSGQVTYATNNPNSTVQINSDPVQVNNSVNTNTSKVNVAKPAKVHNIGKVGKPLMFIKRQAKIGKPINVHKAKNNRKVNQPRTSFAKFVQSRAPYRYPQIKPNFRDLGGYRTKNGRIVKTGKIYRTQALHNLTPQGRRTLNRLNVRKVIDLRTHHQIARAKDDHGLNVKINPTFSTNGSKDVNRYAKSLGISKNQLGQFRYAKLLASMPTAMRSYHNTFMTLLHNHRGAVAFHCIAGRDRTGMTSALILSALGVPHHTIVNDYLLSDVYENDMPLNQQRSLINAFFHEVNHHYGNVHEYLNHAVGLSNAQISQLQRMYLTK